MYVYEFVGYLKYRIFFVWIGSGFSARQADHFLLPEDYGGFLQFLQGNAGILIQVRSSPSFPHHFLFRIFYDFIIRRNSFGMK
jgi:hypothetical protein